MVQPIRLLIIEDLGWQVEELQRNLEKMPAFQFEILGKCKRLDDAILKTKEEWNNLDIVFLDMTFLTDIGEDEEAGCKYLDALILLSETLGTPGFKIIIWTAHQEQAIPVLQRYKNWVFDFILKSSNDLDDLKRALTKYVTTRHAVPMTPLISSSPIYSLCVKYWDLKAKIQRKYYYRLHPEHILYIKGLHQGCLIWLTQSARKIFAPFLQQEAIKVDIKARSPLPKETDLNDLYKNWDKVAEAIELKKNLSQISEDLGIAGFQGFLRVSDSYIVNKNYWTATSPEGILLTDTSIPTDPQPLMRKLATGEKESIVIPLYEHLAKYILLDEEKMNEAYSIGKP